MVLHSNTCNLLTACKWIYSFELRTSRAPGRCQEAQNNITYDSTRVGWKFFDWPRSLMKCDQMRIIFQKFPLQSTHFSIGIADKHKCYISLWIFLQCIYQTHPQWAACDTRSVVLSGVQLVWIQNFPSPRLVVLQRLKKKSDIHRLRFDSGSPQILSCFSDPRGSSSQAIPDLQGWRRNLDSCMALHYEMILCDFLAWWESVKYHKS